MSDLRHHGDAETGPGLVDFAVNVRGDAPPAWLRRHLVDALDRIGRYPSTEDDLAARRAVAARHGRRAEEVLVLAGTAEAFALLPALAGATAALVHPSFTEPEVALRQAGVPVRHVVLDEAGGYALRPELVPDDADLVVLGNPTNPTSVLHPADTIRALTRPGRVVVVDEAFMDAVPGETESLAGARLPGLLVLRSLTKTWALPGLRAGYALGDPALLARLAAHRPHWPVGTLVLAAVEACAAPHAIAEAADAARTAVAHRAHLAGALRGLPGVEVHEPAAGPFLLLRVRDGARVREGLRRRGIAVRRADTFPGLSDDHLRVAVRDPARTALLVDALRAELNTEVPA